MSSLNWETEIYKKKNKLIRTLMILLWQIQIDFLKMLQKKKF